MIFRDATRADLPVIVQMLAADQLGATRETVTEPIADAYVAAFERIEADPNNRLIVADDNGQVVGCLQLTYIPGLSFSGGIRAEIEGVRVHQRVRGQGVGHKLIRWSIDEAKRHGCRLVQLTTNIVRKDAQRFYLDLGFVASHVGMKLDLRDAR
jgi:GNAT superfamily N-acetyltransferase